MVRMPAVLELSSGRCEARGSFVPATASRSLQKLCYVRTSALSAIAVEASCRVPVVGLSTNLCLMLFRSDFLRGRLNTCPDV